MKSANEYEEAGRELWHKGEYYAALKLLQEGLSGFPGDSTLRLGIAMAHLRLGNYAAARDILRDLAREMPASGDVLAALSEASLNLGNKNEALKAIREAAEKHPDSAMLIEYLATILNQHGLFREAVVYYRKAISVDASRPYAHLGLGVALGRLHKTRDAVAAFQKAISLKNNFFEAQSHLANLLFENKKTAEAIRILLEIPAEQQVEPIGLSRLINFCKKNKKLNSKVPALEARLQEIVNGMDFFGLARPLEEKTLAGFKSPETEKPRQPDQPAGPKFIKVWKNMKSIIPQASELSSMEESLGLIFEIPLANPRLDSLPDINKADKKAVERFFSSLAVYLKGVAEHGPRFTAEPVGHWGRIWSINDIAPYAISLLRRIYDSPGEFVISQLTIDSIFAADVNILKWMPPGLHGSEWLLELGGAIIAFWTRHDMLERLFLMREVLNKAEKKNIEPLVRRGRGWRKWLGFKSERSWAYPSTDLFKKEPKTLGAGEPVRCAKCRQTINDYWDIADPMDTRPVLCGNCAPLKRCPKCQGPMRQVSSFFGKKKEDFSVYRCMECYRKQTVK